MLLLTNSKWYILNVTFSRCEVCLINWPEMLPSFFASQLRKELPIVWKRLLSTLLGGKLRVNRRYLSSRTVPRKRVTLANPCHPVGSYVDVLTIKWCSCVKLNKLGRVLALLGPCCNLSTHSQLRKEVDNVCVVVCLLWCGLGNILDFVLDEKPYRQGAPFEQLSTWCYA